MVMDYVKFGHFLLPIVSEVLEPQAPGSLWVCSGIYSDYFAFTLDSRRGKW